MQKTLVPFAAALVIAGSALAGQAGRPAGRSGVSAVNSFYDLKTTTLVGNKPADLATYRGRVTLVVNVASYCGYTPQYKGLEALHRELGHARDASRGAETPELAGHGRSGRRQNRD